MKRIVFINQDVGYLMIDIINKFASEGYECVLITGRVVERKNPLDKRVKVDRIIRYSRNSIFSRIISWIVGFIQLLQKLFTSYRKDVLFIVSNPPLAPLLPLFCKNRHYQLIFDLDIVRVLDLGIFKRSKLLSRYWKKIATRAMSKAESVFTLTKGMAQLLQPFTLNKTVHVMPLWTDNEEFAPVAKRDNPFVKENQLDDKFVVMYSGNLGALSGVMPLVNVARATKNPNIQFLIIGEGIRKEALIKKRNEYGLDNCKFLPWQKPEVLPFSLASADLAVICLAGSESKRSIPSKLYNNMSVGNPVLAIANHDSDLADVVTSMQIGSVFEASEIEAIADYIDALSKDKSLQKVLRSNSLKASKEFTSDNINIILNVI